MYNKSSLTEQEERELHRKNLLKFKSKILKSFFNINLQNSKFYEIKKSNFVNLNIKSYQMSFY